MIRYKGGKGHGQKIDLYSGTKNFVLINISEREIAQIWSNKRKCERVF